MPRQRGGAACVRMEWLELPVPSDVVRELRKDVRRPVYTLSAAGGAYHTLGACDVVKSQLDAHLQAVVQAFVDCGWQRADDHRVVSTCRNGGVRLLRLVWPWEWTDSEVSDEVPDANRFDLCRADGSAAKAVALPPCWQQPVMESLVHSPLPVNVPNSKTSRCIGLDVSIDDVVSQVTDRERHRVFVSVRRNDIVVQTRDGSKARFLCNAHAAHSTKNGIVRFFCPEGDASLQGFVSTHASVLTCAPTSASAQNIVYCDPVSSAANTERVFFGFLLGMTDVDLCAHFDVPIPSTDAFREHGLVPSTGSHLWTWPHRLMLLRHLARTCGQQVYYVEKDARHESFSSQMVVSDANGKVRTCPVHLDADVACVVWDGQKWGVRKRGARACMGGAADA